MRSIVLVILDGWGIAPKNFGNAIANSSLPNIKRVLANFPNSKLLTSGQAVGLLNNDPGNTEIGHVNIGAGRIIRAPISQIDEEIKNGAFFKNKAFRETIAHLAEYGGNLHLMGLFGSGHIHASSKHLLALLKLAKRNNIKNVYLHLFTDGRDSPRTAALSGLSELQNYLQNEGIGAIASISGRFFAMDRDKRLARTKKAYQVIRFGQGEKADSVTDSIENYYKCGVTDEFISPTIFTDNSGQPFGLVRDNDAVIFYNHRGERAIQLTEFFIPDIKKVNIFFTTMTEFDRHLAVSAVAYWPETIRMTLGEVLSSNGTKQLRMAETEKERFVTYYFNGHREDKFPGEDRIIIPSPKVATYDLKPEMSAQELADTAVVQIKSQAYPFILINFANPDMVGHTGLFKPTVQACEAVDTNLGKIIDAVLAVGSTLMITADHGNAEEMIDVKTGLVLTEHTTNPVPVILVGQESKSQKLREGGILADVAPTILKLMEIPISQEMTGKSLLA